MYLRRSLTRIRSVAAASLLLGHIHGTLRVAHADSAADDLWRRTHRVFAYDAPRRARYPSLARDKAGELIVLFTHVTKVQEDVGVGDVMMIRSADKGETWSTPERVYQAGEGEPRTMGTLARLRSGRLVAAVAEVGKEPQPKLVRLLSSQDGGRTWQAGEPLAFEGMTWAQPYGRLMEDEKGVLLMPVYGARTAAEAPEPRNSCGLIRSTDGGLTWGDFSEIAGGGRITHPAVLTAGDGSFAAILSRGPELVRCESQDNGYTWTAADPVHQGSIHFTYDLGRTWTRLAPAGGYADPFLVDANTLWVGNQQAWGEFGCWRRVPAAAE